MSADPADPRPPADWRKTSAFGLPTGSIRAILALLIFGTTWALLVMRAEVEVPDYLRDLLLIILGHYFAARHRPEPAADAGPAPLFLPRGTIRAVLVLGSIAAAVVLYRNGRLHDVGRNPGVVSLLLVGGFLLGVVFRAIAGWLGARRGGLPRIVEDLRASVVLLAAAGLVVLVWDRYFPYLPPFRNRLGGIPLRLGQYGPEHVLAAVVGFYFGSRS